jgi:hypothetical protein
VQIVEAKASMVDDLQNRNQELMKQIEICQVVPLFPGQQIVLPHAGACWMFIMCVAVKAASSWHS